MSSNKSANKNTPSKKSRKIFPIWKNAYSGTILERGSLNSHTTSRKKTLYNRLFGNKVVPESSPKLSVNPLLSMSTKSEISLNNPEDVTDHNYKYEYYPITEKSNINLLTYNNGARVNKGDELFLCTGYSPIGRLRDVRTTHENKIEKFKIINDIGRTTFSEKFPEFASVPIDNLPLYVRKRKNTGGKKNKSRKNKKGGK